jgi:putative transposase
MSRKSRAKPPGPFRCFNSAPEVIRLVVLMYVRFPLSLRNVEDLLFERGIDLSHETVRFWWNGFGPMFAGDIRRRRISHMRGFRHWRWHLDEMYVLPALEDIVHLTMPDILHNLGHCAYQPCCR